MSENCLVLSMDFWEFPDEKTGELKSGGTCWYMNNYRDDAEGSLGLKPTKLSIPSDRFAPIMAKVKAGGLPAIYGLDFGTRPGKENKPTLVLVDLLYVRTPDIFPDDKPVSATSGIDFSKLNSDKK